MKRAFVVIAILILTVVVWKLTTLENRPASATSSAANSAAVKSSARLSTRIETPADVTAVVPDMSADTTADAAPDAPLGETALETVRTGTVSEVLLALPKIAQSPDSTVQEAAKLQPSLCRFQNDELGFEIVKYKFTLLFVKLNMLRPWNTLCSG